MLPVPSFFYCSWAECDVDKGRPVATRNVLERALPIGHFIGRGLFYLHLEAGTRRLTIHVGLERLAAICYGTP